MEYYVAISSSNDIELTINCIIKEKKQDIPWDVLYATHYEKKDKTHMFIFTFLFIDKI